MAEAVEQVFKASTPDGRWVVEVVSVNDRFVSTVTLDGQHLIEKLVTDDSDRMIRWTYKQMAEAMRRSKGEKGRQTDGTDEGQGRTG